MENLNDARDLNLRRKVRFSIGTGNLGAVQNVEGVWGRLCKMLSEPRVTPEKFIEYQRASDKQRAALKNAGGYWIGAHCDTGRRKTNTIRERDVVCFDIDNGDLWPGPLVQSLRDRKTGVSEFEFFVHSSRSHTVVKPKLRLVFLLSKPVSAEKYSAFVRILAHRLDPKMETVDPVSFRLAQMMFMPTVSSDMVDQFVAFRNEGKLVNPDEILASWGPGWTDYSKLPRGAHEKTLRQIAEKAENPLTKGGLVGAFCRTYDVPAAISEFLPDLFVESDVETVTADARYKYVHSEGGPGAVLYDGGLFLYSHHGSDPYSDRLLNAWDLVRLHKFGHEDEDESSYERVVDMPSYKSMVELSKRDPRVKKTLAMENFSAATELMGSVEDKTEPEDIVEDLVGPAEPAPGKLLNSLIGAVKGDDAMPALPPSKEWLRDLELTDKLALKSTIQNLQIILTNDPGLRGAFRRNRFTGNVDVCRDLVSRSNTLKPLKLKKAGRWAGQQITDIHLTWLQAFLDDKTSRDGGGGYGCKFGRNTVAEAIELVANHDSYHPVIDWINSEPWDGVERVETFFSEYVGAEDSIYTRQVARALFVAASARLMEPGHKFDYAVILEGLQGIRKSTLVSALANDQWFGELNRDVENGQKVVEQTRGRWFVELPELSAFGKREAEEIKAFVSQTGVQARMAYARYESVSPRQFVLVGTTNKDTYLKDETGNRRFWPVPVPAIDIDVDRIRRDIQQIHAEAMVMFLRMRQDQPEGDLPLYLTDPGARAIQESLALSRSTDETEAYWAERISTWLDRPVSRAAVLAEHGIESDPSDEDTIGVRGFATPVTIYVGALGGKAMEFHEGISVRIRKAMRSVPGWVDGGRVRVSTGSKDGTGNTRVRSFWRQSEDGSRELWRPIEIDLFDLI